MERALYITRYRNMGITKPQRFVLNSFTDMEHMGNLVIIVGPNNSGKSNVLAALKEYSQKTFDKNDVTTLSFDEKASIPQLSLSFKGDDTQKCEYTYRISYDGNLFVKYPKVKENTYLTSKSDLSELISDLQDLHNCFVNAAVQYGYVKTYGNIPQLTNLIRVVSEKYSNATDENYIEIENMVRDVMYNFSTSNAFYKLALDWFRNNNQSHSKFVRCFYNSGETDAEKINNAFSSAYGIEFFPQIIQYCDTPICNNNIITTVSAIASNKFFVGLFEVINYKLDNLLRAYEAFGNSNHKGILKTQETAINAKLKKVANDFNRLYNFDSDKYRFEISLESNNIFFSIFNGNAACVLDRQSTGFRWFFDLYFNLLCKKSMGKGDIILMDEPATNLHVQGQRELRKFLKDFAIKNGITIVLATHSPFLIDMDYLDELRVVEASDGEAFINNDFSAISIDDQDSLLPIKRALTVDSCHLYDPDKKVVFVEGITDYNYLMAFKKILNIDEDIIFLPIHGIGNSSDMEFKETQKQISKRLIELRKHDPVLLVDGDNVGKSMQSVNSSDSALTVIALSDIDAEFKTIESLFDEKDLKKYKFVDATGKYIKHNSTSSSIKTYANEYRFSDKTKNNFKKLFDRLKLL